MKKVVLQTQTSDSTRLVALSLKRGNRAKVTIDCLYKLKVIRGIDLCQNVWPW